MKGSTARVAVTEPRRALLGLGLANVSSTAVNLIFIEIALHSTVALGTVIVGVRVLPSLVLPIVMGHLGDRFERRPLLVASSLAAVVSPTLLLMVSAPRAELFVVVIAAVAAALSDSAWAAMAAPAAYARARDAEHRMRLSVRMGYGWDIGKLVGAGAVAVSGTVGLVVAMVAGCAAAAVAQGLSQQPVEPGVPREGRVAWRDIIFPGTGLIILGVTLASLFGMDYNLLASAAAIGTHLSAGTLMALFASGAILGTVILELCWPPTLRTFHIGGATLAGAALLLSTGLLSVVALPVLGVGAAMLWQSWRGIAGSRMPQAAQARWSGGAYTVQRVGMSVGSPTLAALVLLGHRGLVLLAVGAMTSLGVAVWSVGTGRFIQSLTPPSPAGQGADGKLWEH